MPNFNSIFVYYFIYLHIHLIVNGELNKCNKWHTDDYKFLIEISLLAFE